MFIINGVDTNLYIDKIQIKGNYTEEQQLTNRNNLIKNGIKGQNAMDEE